MVTLSVSRRAAKSMDGGHSFEALLTPYRRRNAAKKASARKKAEQEQHKRGAQSYDALKASLDAAFDIAARERHQCHQPAQPAQPHLSDCSGAAPSVPDFQDDPGQRGQRYQADGVATAPAAVAASAPNADYVVSKSTAARPCRASRPAGLSSAAMHPLL